MERGEGGGCIPFIGLSSTGQIVLNSYNGTVITVNGVFFGQSATFTYASSGLPMVATLGQSLSGNLCAHNSFVPGPYIGHIDEFYIFSRELSHTDITALANP